MRFVRWLAGFFEAHALQSMCRLCALLSMCGALIVALKDPKAWQTVGAFVGAGAVALLTRTKNGQAGPPSAPSSP